MVATLAIGRLKIFSLREDIFEIQINWDTDRLPRFSGLNDNVSEELSKIEFLHSAIFVSSRSILFSKKELEK